MFWAKNGFMAFRLGVDKLFRLALHMMHIRDAFVADVFTPFCPFLLSLVRIAS